MKNAPCARLGILIRPKMSEKPDDNRNSRPPKATLFSVWMIQNCHCIEGPRRAFQGPLVPARGTPRRSRRGDPVAGTESILDSRFGGNERRLNGDLVALGKQDVMPATS